MFKSIQMFERNFWCWATLEKLIKKWAINGFNYCSIPKCIDFNESWCSKKANFKINFYAQKGNH